MKCKHTMIYEDGTCAQCGTILMIVRKNDEFLSYNIKNSLPKTKEYDQRAIDLALEMARECHINKLDALERLSFELMCEYAWLSYCKGTGQNPNERGDV